MFYGGITTTPYTYSTVAANYGGTSTWVNPGNANVSDNVRATITALGSTAAANFAYLNTSGYGFSIPTGSTILGISVGVEALRSTGSLGDARLSTVQLFKEGVPVGSNLGTTTAVSTIESVIPFGGASNLWGTTWKAEDINSANFGVGMRPTGSASNANRNLNVDSVSVSVTYVVPASDGSSLPLSYTNSSTGAQSYSLRYAVPLSYTNAGTGTQLYLAQSTTMLAYLNSGVGTQSYTVSFAAPVSPSFSYTNTGTATQSYSAKFGTRLAYSNTGNSSQSYALTAKTALAYVNMGTGSQAYALLLSATGFGYINSGVGTLSYSASFKTSFAYSNSSTGSQSYATRQDARLSYVNSGIGSQTYTLREGTTLAYSNAGAGSQSYILTGTKPAVLPQNYGGGITHVRKEEPKPTRQEKKALKKAKLHLVDQDKVDALKSSIQVDVPVDPYWLEQIELARLMMEQELAARLEEEEMQMVVVMALAHHRRNRFHRLAA